VLLGKAQLAQGDAVGAEEALSRAVGLGVVDVRVGRGSA
jgi:hypothetical protein